MKKIIALFLFFISASVFAQVKIGGAIQQTSSADNYPTHTDTTQYGGYRVVADTFARNNIKSSYRKIGMMVYCSTPAKTYQLIGGVANSNWALSAAGTDSVTVARIARHTNTLPVDNAVDSIISVGDGATMAKTAMLNIESVTFSSLSMDTIKAKAIENGITASNNLLIQSTGNTTKGNIVFGVSGIVYTPRNTKNTGSDSISNAGGITSVMIKSGVMYYNQNYAADITANPQIVAGTDGQIIEIVGLSDTKTLKLDDGTGLQLAGGNSFTLGAGDDIRLRYVTLLGVWIEVSRSDN